MVASTTESSKAAPDAEFAPEQQMASILGLCEAQMESALHDSDKAVEALIGAFTGLVDTSRSVSTLANNLPPEIKDTVARELEQQIEAMAKQMASAVVAFQFYDKLTQRLGHVRYSLSTLAMFVCDRTQSARPDQWKRLLNTLRRLYRTDEERQIFQMIMDGVAADAANEQIVAATEPARIGEVEIF